MTSKVEDDRVSSNYSRIIDEMALEGAEYFFPSSLFIMKEYYVCFRDVEGIFQVGEHCFAVIDTSAERWSTAVLVVVNSNDQSENGAFGNRIRQFWRGGGLGAVHAWGSEW
jgi:hypothetical protein